MMKNKRYPHGFTLIEMLVVVLIVGILAGIALPQYNKAVEKARLSEVLINVKAIEDSIDRYLLTNGFQNASLRDMLDVDLQGGEWVLNGGNYYYKNGNNEYQGACGIGDCQFVIGVDNCAVLNIGIIKDNDDYKDCYTMDTDKGRFVCKYLESFGWDYYDEEW